jgi:CubicO group peptidase (beta-lactamase class C family)
MDAVRRLILVVGTLVVAYFGVPRGYGAEPGAARDFAGLWEAKRRFGPDLRGTLTVGRSADLWQAEIAGHQTPVKVSGEVVTLEFPEGQGSFRGKFDAGRTQVIGQWNQAARVENGTAYASPVTLTQRGPELWRGEVRPLDDEMTFYLMVTIGVGGKVAAFLRNPERNAGRFINVDHLELEGNSVRLMGKGRDGKDRLQAEGVHQDGVLSLHLPSQGGTFDFRRVKDGAACDFYPRGHSTPDYTYAPPPAGDDGWPVASLEDVDISRDALRRFVRMLIDTPIDSVHAQEFHGVLIARHGKLVLEEYFHGEHREKPHDTRSAAKSLTSTLVGSAIEAGVPVALSTPVYQVMNGGAFALGLEPRKRALTLEHLLTMSSGLDCDDSDDKSVGNEDTMQDQTAQPDWYRYTMDLRAVRDPGMKAVYGSANPNLAGGVLARAAGRPLTQLFHELLAEPLGIKRYYMNLTPMGEAYMGGGVRFLPRDFMKLGQLILNGGTWNGRRLVSADWCHRATSPLYELHGLHYGYLWWVTDYPYEGHTVRAFFAGGNGGQVVVGVPDLDLVIAFYGGNYSDPALYVPQRVYVPKHILPAVKDNRQGR